MGVKAEYMCVDADGFVDLEAERHGSPLIDSVGVS